MASGTSGRKFLFYFLLTDLRASVSGRTRPAAAALAGAGLAIRPGVRTVSPVSASPQSSPFGKGWELAGEGRGGSHLAVAVAVAQLLGERRPAWVWASGPSPLPSGAPSSPGLADRVLALWLPASASGNGAGGHGHPEVRGRGRRPWGRASPQLRGGGPPAVASPDHLPPESVCFVLLPQRFRFTCDFS